MRTEQAPGPLDEAARRESSQLLGIRDGDAGEVQLRTGHRAIPDLPCGNRSVLELPGADAALGENDSGIARAPQRHAQRNQRHAQRRTWHEPKKSVHGHLPV